MAVCSIILLGTTRNAPHHRQPDQCDLPPCDKQQRVVGSALCRIPLTHTYRCRCGHPHSGLHRTVAHLLRHGIILSGIAGCIPSVLLWGFYNILRFETFFATGYGTESIAFDTPFLTGLWGLLVSGGSGLVWYAPFVIWMPVGALYWWRHNRPLLVTCLALCISHFLLYASWSAWDGGGVWGPRFLVPVIPAALLVAAGVSATPSRLVRSTAQLTVVLGIGITLLGSAVNFSLDANLPLPRDIPPIAHARILWDRLQNSTVPAQTCRIEAIWYPSEAADGILWQRSNGDSTFTCTLAASSILRLRLDDRRPPDTAPSRLALHHADQYYSLPEGSFRVVQLLGRMGTQQYRLTSMPWNRATLGISDRDDALGPTLLAISAVPPLRQIRDASIAPMPSQPMRRWAWYYEPTNRHPGDWWVWYLPATALAPWSAWPISGWCLLWAGCLTTSAVVWRHNRC